MLQQRVWHLAKRMTYWQVISFVISNKSVSTDSGHVVLWSRSNGANGSWEVLLGRNINLNSI